MTLAVSKDALCFVKQRENQIVLTICALLHYTDVVNKIILLAFHSVSSVLFRDKRRYRGDTVKSKQDVLIYNSTSV